MRSVVFLLLCCSPLVTSIAQEAVAPPEAQEDTVTDSQTGKSIKVSLDSKVFSPDGRIYAGFYWHAWDEHISLHDAKTGKQLRQFFSWGFVEKIKFSEDGKLLASFTDRWRVHDVETGKLLLTLPKAEAP